MKPRLSTELQRNHCPDCDDLLSHGAGHGKSFAFQWRYCHSCKKFIEFNCSGLTEEKQQEFKAWVIEQLIAMEKK